MSATGPALYDMLLYCLIGDLVPPERHAEALAIADAAQTAVIEHARREYERGRAEAEALTRTRALIDSLSQEVARREIAQAETEERTKYRKGPGRLSAALH